MKAIYSKISIFFFAGVVALMFGCDNSLNIESVEKNEKNGSVRISGETTVINDGLQPTGLNISSFSATNFVTAGTGTHSGNAETISVEVPSGATVEAVFLYWARRGSESDPDPAKIKVDGTEYEGNIIGGPVDMPDADEDKAGVSYRVELPRDIVVPGTTSTFTVRDNDLSETTESLGASVLVFYSLAGEQSELIIYDGVDFLYLPYKNNSSLSSDQKEALATAMPVTFTFDPASVEREAVLTLFIGDVEPADANERPNSLVITIGDATTIIGPPTSSSFPFQAFEGAQWDNYVKSITIPAGVGKVTVEPRSGPKVDGKELPASLLWSMAGLSVPIPQIAGGGEGCTPGYWKQNHHFDSWPAPYSPKDKLEDPFNVPRNLKLARPEREDPENLTLIEGLELRGGKVNALIRHAVAALLNAASDGVSFNLTVNEVITKFNDAVDKKGNRKREIRETKNEFENFNEQGCPLN